MQDFNFDALESRAVDFLTSRCSPRQASSLFKWGEGSDDVSLWDRLEADSATASLDESRAFRMERFRAGFGWLDGPIENGGAGLPVGATKAYARIESKFEVPTQYFFRVDRVVAPAVVKYGSAEIKASLLPALFTGDVIMAELFSESAAGSDLRAVETSLKETADGWELSGEKVWSPDAHLADFGLVLARVEPPRAQSWHDRDALVAAEEGPVLVAVVVDMAARGVKVNPMVQMTGDSAFNAVTFDSVFIPRSHQLGPTGEGWRIVREVLARGRAGIATGLGNSGRGITSTRRIVELVRSAGLQDDPVVRQQLAELMISLRSARWLSESLRKPSSSASPLVGKLLMSQNLRALSHFVTEVLGPKLQADTGAWGSFAWTQFVLGEPGVHLMAGTDEVVTNLLAEQVLGLPRHDGGTRG